MPTWELVAQFGLAGVIFGGFILVLNWVFKVNYKILDDMAKERESNLKCQERFAENIKENNILNMQFQKAVDEAHKYQRQEHKEMIDILGRINSYKHV